MSENPNIERAATVMETRNEKRLESGYKYPSGMLWYEELARTLSSAGLLVTPLHGRALEACEAYARAYTPNYFIETSPANAVQSVGRESLALKEKAKGAKEDDYGVQVLSTGTALVMLHTAPVGSRVVYSGTESQARRVAAALNEGDES